MSNLTNEPRWLGHALAAEGVMERPGAANNPRVMAYYRAVGHDWVEGDSTPWCAAFAGACIEHAGIRSTRSLRARSFLEWGRSLKTPRRGAIVVFSRGRNPAYGHVGFYLRETAKYVVVIGGNQSDKVSVARYAKSRLLGYRWPGRKDIAPYDGDDARFERVAAYFSDTGAGWPNPDAEIVERHLAQHRGGRVSSDPPFSAAQKKALFHSHIWRDAGAGRLPAGLDLYFFVTAIERGGAHTTRHLQHVLGVEADGEVGPVTLAAVHRQSTTRIIEAFDAALGATDREDAAAGEPQPLRRVERGTLLAAALGRASTDEPDSSPRAAKRRTINTTQTTKETGMRNDDKWWVESLTIWGTLITALSTVLPIIGPFFGLDISAAMIEQFGESVAQIIQALGGVTGSFMAIYGRLRASSRLSRKPVALRL